MTDPIGSVVIPIIVSALVTYALVPRIARRDEAARRDLAARRAAEAELGKVRRKLVREFRLRTVLQRGFQVGVNKLMTVYDFEEAIWPVLNALDDPALARRVAEDVRGRLADLMGGRSLEFIRSESEAPRTPSTLRETTARLVESGAMDDIVDHLQAAAKTPATQVAPVTPVDAMFRSGDPEQVADVIRRLDEIINALR